MANNVQNILVNPLLLVSALTLTGCSKVSNSHAFPTQHDLASKRTQQVRKESKQKMYVRPELADKRNKFEYAASAPVTEIGPLNRRGVESSVKDLCNKFEAMITQSTTQEKNLNKRGTESSVKDLCNKFETMIAKPVNPTTKAEALYANIEQGMDNNRCGIFFKNRDHISKKDPLETWRSAYKNTVTDLYDLNQISIDYLQTQRCARLDIYRTRC